MERTVEEYIELYKRLTPVIFKKLYFYQNISLGPYQIDLENLIFEGYDAIHNLIGTVESPTLADAEKEVNDSMKLFVKYWKRSVKKTLSQNPPPIMNLD